MEALSSLALPGVRPALTAVAYGGDAGQLSQVIVCLSLSASVGKRGEVGSWGRGWAWCTGCCHEQCDRRLNTSRCQVSKRYTGRKKKKKNCNRDKVLERICYSDTKIAIETKVLA